MWCACGSRFGRALKIKTKLNENVTTTRSWVGLWEATKSKYYSTRERIIKLLTCPILVPRPQLTKDLSSKLVRDEIWSWKIWSGGTKWNMNYFYLDNGIPHRAYFNLLPKKAKKLINKINLLSSNNNSLLSSISAPAIIWIKCSSSADSSLSAPLFIIFLWTCLLMIKIKLWLCCFMLLSTYF